jgi:hypothetical protein
LLKLNGLQKIVELELQASGKALRSCGTGDARGKSLVSIASRLPSVCSVSLLSEHRRPVQNPHTTFTISLQIESLILALAVIGFGSR